MAEWTNRRDRSSRRASARRRDAGYAMLAVMIGISIVSVALVNQAIVVGYAALASRGARSQFACRVAALAVLDGPAPATSGGSVAPDAPVADWSDTVYYDPATGAIVPAEGGVPGGAILVSRQWRRGTDSAGRAVFETTATAVDAAGSPLGGWFGARVALGRRVR